MYELYARAQNPTCPLSPDLEGYRYAWLPLQGGLGKYFQKPKPLGINSGPIQGLGKAWEGRFL